MAKRGLVLLGLLYSAMSFAGELESLVHVRINPAASSSNLTVDIQHTRFLDDPSGLTLLVDKMLTAAQAQPFVDVIVIKVSGQTEYILPGTSDPTPWQQFAKGLIEQAKYRYGEKTVQTLLKGLGMATVGALLTTISTGPLSAFALAGLAIYVGWESAKMIDAFREGRYEDAGRMLFDTLNDVAWSLAGGGFASWLIRKQGTTGLGLLLSSLRNIIRKPPRIDVTKPLPPGTFSLQTLPKNLVVKPSRAPVIRGTKLPGTVMTAPAPRVAPKPAPSALASAEFAPWAGAAVVAPTVAFASTDSTLLESLETWEKNHDWNTSFKPVIARLRLKLKSQRASISRQDRADFALLLSIVGAKLADQLKDFARMHTDLPSPEPWSKPAADDLTLLNEALAGQRSFWHLQILLRWADRCDQNPGAHAACAKIRKLRDTMALFAGKRMSTIIKDMKLQEFYAPDNFESFLQNAFHYFQSLAENETTRIAFLKVRDMFKAFSSYEKSDLKLILGLYAVNLADTLYRRHFDDGSFKRDWVSSAWKFYFIQKFLFEGLPEHVISPVIFSPIAWAVDALVGKKPLYDIYARAVRESLQGVWSPDHRDALMSLALFERDPKNPVDADIPKAQMILEGYEIRYGHNRYGLPALYDDPTSGATTREEAFDAIAARKTFDALSDVIPNLVPEFDFDELFSLEEPRLNYAQKHGHSVILDHPDHPYMWVRANQPLGWELHFAYLVSEVFNHGLALHERFDLAPVRLIASKGWFVIDMRVLSLPKVELPKIPAHNRAALALLDALLDVPLSPHDLSFHYNHGAYMIARMSSPFYKIPLMHWILNKLPDYGFTPESFAEAARPFAPALASTDFDRHMKIIFDRYRLEPNRKLSDFLARKHALLQFLQNPVAPLTTPSNPLPDVSGAFAFISPQIKNALPVVLQEQLLNAFYLGGEIVNPSLAFSAGPELALEVLRKNSEKEDPRSYLYNIPFAALKTNLSSYPPGLLRILAANAWVDHRTLNETPVYVLVMRTFNTTSETTPSRMNANLQLLQDVTSAANSLSYLYVRDDPQAGLKLMESIRKAYLAKISAQPDHTEAGHAVWDHFWRAYRHERTYLHSLQRLVNDGELPRFLPTLKTRIQQGAFGTKTDAKTQDLNAKVDQAYTWLRAVGFAYEEKINSLITP